MSLHPRLFVLLGMAFVAQIGVASAAPAFMTVSAGAFHTCALTNAGAAYCWGANGNGELGDGTTIDRLTATRVAGGIRFGAVSAGDGHTCGLSSDGVAYCWGSNIYGQLGDGGTSDHLTPVMAASDVRFLTVSAGWDHTCGVASDGTALCWGRNDSGQLGDGTTTDRSTRRNVKTLVRFKAVSAGSSYSCGVERGAKVSGALYCWGNNESGQLGDGTTANSSIPVRAVNAFVFSSVNAGVRHTCAILGTEGAFCWGNNEYGQLGNGTTSALGGGRVPGGSTVVAVDVGAMLTCGVMPSETYCWGDTSYGQLGIGIVTVTMKLIPSLVDSSETFKTISAAHAHSCGITTGGGTFCWGHNYYGQLGDGTTIDRNKPQKVK
jgi:alpha-tubulin suppressor-like RCC1 family protein